MSDVKCARVLIESAERDVEVLRVILDSGKVSDEVFGFHVQQAVEKALKAWIAVLGELYPLTHDLEELLEMLAALGADTQRYEQLVGYTGYAVEFRYTGIPPGTDPIERQSAVTLVEVLLNKVRAEFAAVEAEG